MRGGHLTPLDPLPLPIYIYIYIKNSEPPFRATCHLHFGLSHLQDHFWGGQTTPSPLRVPIWPLGVAEPLHGLGGCSAIPRPNGGGLATSKPNGSGFGHPQKWSWSHPRIYIYIYIYIKEIIKIIIIIKYGSHVSAEVYYGDWYRAYMPTHVE
jgi:hypothetical protein